MPKRGMGRDPLDWIGQGARAARPARRAEPPPQASQVPQLPSGELPKYRTLIPVTARLTEDQLDFLESMERRIMRSRVRKHERITKNSLIRAAIEALRRVQFDTVDIADEEELTQRICAALGLPAEPPTEQ